MRMHIYAWRGRSDANKNLLPAIVKAEKMHLYVPTLYVYVYQKFGEKGRSVEREKRDRIMYTAGASLSKAVWKIIDNRRER